MRSIRTRQYTLIWNLAHPLPYPHASDCGIRPPGRAFSAGKTAASASVGLRRTSAGRSTSSTIPSPIRTRCGTWRGSRDSALREELKERLRRVLEQSNDPWLVESAR